MPDYNTRLNYYPTNDPLQAVTLQEVGQPLQMVMQGLTPSTDYTVRASAYDGLQFLCESLQETFTTIAAGTITLTHSSTVKSGSNYVVTYTASSTYALSSAILDCNSSSFQGTISGSTITFTVSGLNEGTYPYTVTANDIYAESASGSGTITAEHDYSLDYFTIKNAYSGSNKIYAKKTHDNTPVDGDLYVSTDGGSTWTLKTVSDSQQVELATLNVGGRLLIRHNGAMGCTVWVGYSESDRRIKFLSDQPFDVEGNAASLVFDDSFAEGGALTEYGLSGILGGSKVVDASNLVLSSFTTLSRHCFNGMFKNCDSLTVAPSPPATNLAENCCNGMFAYCDSLVVAPSLPATNLAAECYREMFKDCKSLAVAPSLPATNLATLCYLDMFSGCDSLTVAPSLSATSLAWDACLRMFNNCTSLKKGVDLRHVTTMDLTCMEDMYRGCTSLVEAYAPTPSTWDSSKTEDWLNGVASVGILYANASIASQIPTSSASGCPTGWTVYSNQDAQGTDYFTVTTQSQSSNPIRLYGSSGSIEVSTDGGSTWSTVSASTADGGTVIASLSPSSKSFKARHTGSMFGMRFVGSYPYSVGGNASSLILGDSYSSSSNQTVPQQGFSELFKNDTNIVNAAALNFNCYSRGGVLAFHSMFEGCTSLLFPCDFRTVTYIDQGGFNSTFRGCSSLIECPNLSNLTFIAQTAFAHFFRGCSSITMPPDISNADYSGDIVFDNSFNGCSRLLEPAQIAVKSTVSYGTFIGMYEGCTSLRHAPNLSGAERIGQQAFQSMFKNCTSLTEVPSLPMAREVFGTYAFKGMFEGCTGITEGIDIRGITKIAAGTEVFSNMYSGCTSLATAYAPSLRTWDTSQMNSWMNGVAASGTLYTADSSVSSTIPTASASGCPSGWSVVAGADAHNSEYFTIQNVDTVAGTVTLTATSANKTVTVEASTDGGSTWTEFESSTAGTDVCTLQMGESVMLRHTGSMASSQGSTKINCTAKHIVKGNAASLIAGSSFTGTITPLDYSFDSLFSGDSNLVRACDLSFKSFQGTKQQFGNCLFRNCTSLIIAPEFTSITHMSGNQIFDRMFNGCSKLGRPIEMRHIDNCTWRGCFDLYKGCSVLAYAYPPNVTTEWTWAMFGDWLGNVASSGTVYVNSQAQSELVPTGSTNGCPTNWTVEVSALSR